MIFVKKLPHRADGFSYLHDYHPYRLEGERNPSFNANDGSILDLKEGQDAAIQKFVSQLAPSLGKGFAIARVPSSDPAKPDGGFTKFAKRLCTSGITDATACLVRHKKINKLAEGGDRSIEVHLGSIRVEKTDLIILEDVLLLDDVTTTGNSLAACRRLLLDAGAMSVECVAIGKTVH